MADPVLGGPYARNARSLHYMVEERYRLLVRGVLVSVSVSLGEAYVEGSSGNLFGELGRALIHQEVRSLEEIQERYPSRVVAAVVS